MSRYRLPLMLGGREFDAAAAVKERASRIKSERQES